MGAATDFDVIVVGAGPNGATTAALLARHGGLPPARIALLAPGLTQQAAAAGGGAGPDANAADAPPELRVSALSRASEQVLRHAGAWERLPAARLCACERMRIWHESEPPDSIDALVFDAGELAEPDLGHIVENRLLAEAALAAFVAAGGALLDAELRSLQVSDEAAHLTTGAGGHSTRLLVGADGARSLVRAQLGVAASEHDYRQQALVATVATARPHQHCAWQRFSAEGTLALLPLFNGQCSIVWAVPPARASELLALPPDAFAARLDAASDRALGRTQLVSERRAIALRRITAGRLVAPRVALLGDAAHQIHPLAGQGMNLGMLDAAALCEAVAGAVEEREDPGALRSLRRYEQRRLTHDTLMSWSMSAFKTLFARGGLSGWLGARALGLAGASAASRRLFARQALGLAGEVPRWARVG